MALFGRLALCLLTLGAGALAACGPNAAPRPAQVRSQPEGVDPSRQYAAESSFTSAAPAAPDAGPLSGRMLFIKDGNLWRWEGGATSEVAVGWTWRQPRWSPDGSHFAYVYQGANFSDIFVSDRSGETQTRLTRSQSTIIQENSWNFRPTWSPDGNQIAFVTDLNSYNPTLWVMNANGSGRRPIRTAGLAQDAVDQLSWSPDGNLLAATVFYSADPSQIALIPTDPNTRESAQLVTEHPGGAFDPAWSPDGAWVAYAAREGRGTDIFALRQDGQARQQISTVGAARSPVWSPNGRHLAYLSAQTNQFEIWVVDVNPTADGGLETRNPRQLTRDLSIDAVSGVTWAS